MSFQAYLKAMGVATGRVLGFGEFREQPFHAGWIQRRVYLNGGVAGDGRGDGGANFPLAFSYARSTCLRGGLDGDVRGPKGSASKPLCSNSRAIAPKKPHLLRQEIDQHGMSRRWRSGGHARPGASRRIFSNRTRSWATC